MTDAPLITILTFVPLIGGVVVVGLDPERRRLARGLSLTFSLAAVGLVLLIITWPPMASAC